MVIHCTRKIIQSAKVELRSQWMLWLMMRWFILCFQVHVDLGFLLYFPSFYWQVCIQSHYRVAFYCSYSVRQYKTLLLLRDKLAALFRFPQISLDFPLMSFFFFLICAIYTFVWSRPQCHLLKWCACDKHWESHISQNSLWVSWVRKAPRLGLRNVFNILTSQNHSAGILWCWFVRKQIKSACIKALTHQTCNRFFGLLTGHDYFHIESNYQTAKKQPFHFSDRGGFFVTFAQWTNTSNDHEGCMERCHDTASATTVEKLIVYVCHPERCLRRETQMRKTTILKTTHGKSIADQLGSLGICY